MVDPHGAGEADSEIGPRPREAAADPSLLNPAQRARSLAAATSGEADLVIIGAGVTGAGCALDAATRGLSVVLIDAGDIAVGTSSRSGKTFHGGLRYLEQLNFSLVRHAIVERDLMVRTVAPFISRPAPFLYPLTKHWERPYAGAGILLYDVFGLLGHAVPRHRHFTRRGAVREAPALDPAVVTGGIQYYDVLMDDARHTMAVARTAAACGAQVITRAPVTDFLRAGDRVTGVVVTDALTGQHHQIRGKLVISAAGVWSDELQKMAGANTFAIAPAKGVHLLVRGDAIDSETGILARASDSIIIARRWSGHWLVGTTDTPWDGPRDAPVADADDVRYLLDELNKFLRVKITADDVLGVFAGLRPLLKPVGVDAGTTSALSRDHSVIPGPPGLLTVVGGKYTTYRLMAQDTIDAAISALGLQGFPASATATTPLVGGAGYPALVNRRAMLSGKYGLPAEQIQRLMFRYGSLLEQVLAIGAADPQSIVPRSDWADYLPAELIYAVTAEGAMTLRDVLVRRTHLAIELADGGIGAAPEIARLLTPLLGWDEQETDRQVSDHRAEVIADRAALQEVRRQVRDGAPGDPGAVAQASSNGRQVARTTDGYAGVIFDLDGIVADTEHLWDESWRAYAREHDSPWVESDTLDLQGLSVPEWSRALVRKAHDGGPAGENAENTDAEAGRADEAGRFCIDFIIDAIKGGDDALMPGAVELITAAAKAGPIALATSSARPIIEVLLGRHSLAETFGATVSSAEVDRGKPSPDVYLEAARRVGIADQPVIGIEDSANGIRAVHAAGMYCIAIPNRRFMPPADVLALADYVADDHADALRHLTGLLESSARPDRRSK